MTTLGAMVKKVNQSLTKTPQIGSASAHSSLRHKESAENKPSNSHQNWNQS
jgi:hypothetical protein